MGIVMADSNVQWLGSLFWYSIGLRLEVNADQLLAWADELDLDLVSRPQPRTADAFKSATSRAGAAWSEGDLLWELAFQQVKQTDDVIVRHLYATVTNSRSGASSRDKVAEIKFHRPTHTRTGRRAGSEKITHRIAPFVPATPTLLARVKDVLAEVEGTYADRTEHLAEGTIRKLIREVIEDRMDGLPLPRAGMYFVLPEHREELAKLQTLVRRLGESATLHVVPLADDATQRRLLADALAAEAREVNEAVQLAAKDGDILGRARQQLSARLEAQKRKTALLVRRLPIDTLAGRVALAEASETLLCADPAYRRGLERAASQG